MTDDLQGKTAIVTGGASGIGAALVDRLALGGVNVVIADIRPEPLEAQRVRLDALGCRVATLVTDVSDPAAVERLADFAEARFGDIHLAFNNAGVAMHGTHLHEMPLDDWQWVIDVNIRSIVHAIHHVLPRMLRHGQPGHFVNTASIGGLQVNPRWLTGAYSMTKYAVVALTEALANEHRDSPIRMAVLCPSAVATGFGDADSRPERLGGATARPSQEFLTRTLEAQGLEPDLVAVRVLRAIEDGEFFIFTDSVMRPVIEDRHRRIQQAFDRTEAFLHAIDHRAPEATATTTTTSRRRPAP